MKTLTRRIEGLAVVAAVATVPLTIAQEQGGQTDALMVADWIVWSIFLVELVVGLVAWRQGQDWKDLYWLNITILILSFPLLPGLLQLSRLARLLRLGRIGVASFRGLRSLRNALSQKGLVYVVLLAVLMAALGGQLIHVVEPDVAESPGDGLWWAVVTVTTVGYGDISPATLEGRLIAVVLMVVGIGVISTLAASVAAYFVRQGEPDLNLLDLEERLDRIERLLQRSAGFGSRDLGDDPLPDVTHP